MSQDLTIFSDGACNNQHIGGWAFYCLELNIAVAGTKINTTNNCMELAAVLKILEYLMKLNVNNLNVTIFTDSMYVIGSILLNWKCDQKLEKNFKYIQSIKNVLIFLKNNNNINVDFKHVKGHSGIKENEFVDQLAVISSNI